jgi:hypothetical protein
VPARVFLPVHVDAHGIQGTHFEIGIVLPDELDRLGSMNDGGHILPEFEDEGKDDIGHE